MKRLLLVITVITSTFILIACGNVGSTNTAAGINDTNAHDVTELRIGLVLMDDNPEAGRASDEFLQAMEAAIGIPVVAVEGISHLIGIEAMRGGSLDVMLASPFTYKTAAPVVDVEFLATLHNPDQSAGSTLFITAPENTHINSLADFEGESFAFVDTASLTGFLFPMYQLVSTLDLDHTQMLNPGYFFNTTILSGGHDASLMAAINNDVGGAAVVSTVIDHMIDAGMLTEADFRVIYTMDPSPEAGYIVRSELPQNLIDDLRTFLLEYENTDYFYNVHGSENVRFIPTDPSEFEFLGSLMESLEIGE